MSTSTPAPTPASRPDPDGPGPEVRLRISAAARDLFATQGYEQTTVEAIAERAGVARRTFFRHFRSKEDAIFPDHARIEAVTAAHLSALHHVPPLTALASGVRMVFRSYVDDPVVAVQRYQLTQAVPALRDREIASVSRYTRLFGRYLRSRFAASPDAALHAEAVAAAYVAAHNHVLREWLRGAGEGDPMPALDEAFAWVAVRFAGDVPGSEPPGTAPGSSAGSPTGLTGESEDRDTVIAVFRTGEPIDDVVERISRSL